MRSHRTLVGAAGLGYAVLAGLENQDLLAVPGAGAAPAELVAYYTTPGLPLAGWFGGLALGAYLLFVAGLASLLPPRRRTGWAGLVLLGGGIAGPVLAAAGLTARAVLVSGAARDYPELVTVLHGFYLDARAVAGVFMGLMLAGAAVAARGGGDGEPVLPRWWTAGAPVVGGWLVAGSAAAFTTAPVAGVVAYAGFVADAVWIALAGLVLCLPRAVGTTRPQGVRPQGTRPGPALLAWLLFLAVAVAAGASGVLLLALPGHTGSYFSWPLEPPPLAATVGASYLAAALAYGAGLARGGPFFHWGASRTLLLGIVALSVPVFLLTLAHLEVFDFGRWQAWAWALLFGLFPVAATLALWWGRARPPPADPAAPADLPAPADPAAVAPPAGSLLPVVLPAAAYVGLMLTATVLLWERPDLAAGLAPVSVFGGRVLGGWLLLAAAAAVLASGRALLPLAPATGTAAPGTASPDSAPVGLLVPGLPVAWLLAGLRFPDRLPDYPVWLAFCAGAAVLGTLVVAQSARRRPALASQPTVPVAG